MIVVGLYLVIVSAAVYGGGLLTRPAWRDRLPADSIAWAAIVAGVGTTLVLQLWTLHP